MGLIFAVLITSNTCISMQIFCRIMELLKSFSFFLWIGKKSTCSPFNKHCWIKILCKWLNLHFILKKTHVVFVTSDMSLTKECFSNELHQTKITSWEIVYFCYFMYPATGLGFWQASKRRQHY